jgi:hypothetical protein
MSTREFRHSTSQLGLAVDSDVRLFFWIAVPTSQTRSLDSELPSCTE